MKGVYFLFSLLAALAIYLVFQTKGTLNEISKSVTMAQDSRRILLAGNLLGRTQSFVSSGTALNNSAFFDQASKFLDSAKKQFSEKEHKEILQKFKIIEAKLEALKVKSKKGEEIFQEDLLNLVKKLEDFNFELTRSEMDVYQSQFANFSNLVESFESQGIGTFVLFFLSLVLFSFLAYYSIQKAKLLEEANKAERLRGMLFSTLVEAVFFVDRQGKILAVNSSGSNLLGKDARVVIGKNMNSFFPGAKVLSNNHQEVNSLMGLLDSGAANKNLILFLAGNENSWFRISFQPVKFNEESDSFSMIVSLIDITTQIESHRVIQSQRDQLLESSKMQTIGEMAGGIAHEINNPLSIILGSTESLSLKAQREEYISKETVEKSTSVIFKTVKRITKTVRGLLKMSRGDFEKFENVGVNEILDMTRDFSLNLVEKHKIDLIIEQPESNIYFDCHPTKISQVLINMIKNSIDAISGQKEKWIKVEVNSTFDEVVLSVTDSGPGIPEEIRGNVLMPFFTTKEIGKGTGIGLSLSCTIVDEHRGKISIDADCPNTRFVIKLPIKQDPEKTMESLDDLITDSFKDSA